MERERSDFYSLSILPTEKISNNAYVVNEVWVKMINCCFLYSLSPTTAPGHLKRGFEVNPNGNRSQFPMQKFSPVKPSPARFASFVLPTHHTTYLHASARCICWIRALDGAVGLEHRIGASHGAPKLELSERVV